MGCCFATDRMSDDRGLHVVEMGGRKAAWQNYLGFEDNAMPVCDDPKKSPKES